MTPPEQPSKGTQLNGKCTNMYEAQDLSPMHPLHHGFVCAQRQHNGKDIFQSTVS